MLSLFACLKNLLNLLNGGASLAAQANDADSTSTLTSAPNPVLVIARKTKTADAIFGEVIIGDELICYSMERTAVAIPVGAYKGHKRYSSHLGRIVVGIEVPNRTDIEGHNANFPCQLGGCIAFGSSIDGDALDNSIAALEKVLDSLPQSFTVLVTEQPTA